MDFRKWLEAVATAPPVTSIGSNTGGINNNFDDGDDDDDDEKWNFNNIHKTYGAAVENWMNTSPCAKKIKSRLIDLLFKQPPEISEPEIISEREEVPDNGWVEMTAEWKFDLGEVEDRLARTLRDAKACDVWKAFQIEPKTTWHFLDKGDVFQYIFYALKMSMTGLNSGTAGQKSNVPAQQWLQNHTTWLADKVTISKYAKFHAQEMIDSLEGQVKSYFQDMGKNVTLSLHEAPRARGQANQDNLEASARFTWEYQTEESD